MSEALRRIVEALEDGGEEEAAAVLRAFGAQRRRLGIVRETPRTPLPLSGGCSTVHSEVEWV
ncbi:hypothetical protein GCM10010317_014680 [Streptomyces mirabilis]|uniref:hypothetical protein n=1 Tax=Streptomyces mirabilis TaxID=68239 RepID=UPI00167D6860|nr:hypothetical protein [Streptomyces mirabilis]GHD42828.1 hypothetical protein GCM10010317_014680 [Streptomyces mirabilis]